MTTNISTNDINVANHNDVGILFIVILVCAITSGFNLFTIGIILISNKLRRPANYAVASFLLSASLQALVAAPVYIYKRLNFQHGHSSSWSCDTFRMAYFICGHTMKVSLLIVSFDRLVAIKYPYKYGHIFTKRLMTTVILLSWLCIIFVDLMPFLPVNKEPDAEGCTYRPIRKWGICVIFFFNILPFIIIAINYVMLWIVAANMALKDMRQQESLSRSCDNDDVSITDKLHEIESSNEQHDSIRKCNDNNGNTDMHLYYRRQKSYKKAVSSENYESKVRELNDTIVDSNPPAQDESCMGFMKTRRNKLRFVIEMKATKTSLMLLALYLICWGPLGIFYMVDQFCLKCMSVTSAEHLEATRLAVKILCFASSPLAPLVYCWRTREFRRETYNLVCKKRSRRKRFETFSRSSQGDIHSVRTASMGVILQL